MAGCCCVSARLLLRSVAPAGGGAGRSDPELVWDGGGLVLSRLRYPATGIPYPCSLLTPLGPASGP